MQAMQYKIGLPEDYDMDIIKKRVHQNGYKTDRFDGLLFKAYLITEKSSGHLSNSYCPLYIWKETDGMNKFIFGGFYDNIIRSFGWQKIEVGITIHVDLNESFAKSRYVLEEYEDIPPQSTLMNVKFVQEKFNNELGRVVVYNPEKWKYATFTFFAEEPLMEGANKKLYTILHLSLDK